MLRTTLTLGTSLFALAALAGSAMAFPVTTVFVDIAGACDPLAGPLHTDELGHMPPFPTDEWIDSASTFIPDPACPASDDPGVLNSLVQMTNLTGRTFTEVWYVGEPNLSFFSNVDGTVNGADAFKIDAVGLNRPLIFESIAVNGIFEPGETWGFIVQDYSNAAGMPPDAFDSLGVPSSTAGVAISSASIVAIPGPASLSLLLGAAGAASYRRRRR
jgi:hypothetical protein